jgi:hypothetical protein
MTAHARLQVGRRCDCCSTLYIPSKPVKAGRRGYCSQPCRTRHQRCMRDTEAQRLAHERADRLPPLTNAEISGRIDGYDRRYWPDLDRELES